MQGLTPSDGLMAYELLAVAHSLQLLEINESPAFLPSHFLSIH